MRMSPECLQTTRVVPCHHLTARVGPSYTATSRANRQWKSLLVMQQDQNILSATALGFPATLYSWIVAATFVPNSLQFTTRFDHFQGRLLPKYAFLTFRDRESAIGESLIAQCDSLRMSPEFLQTTRVVPCRPLTTRVGPS